MATAIDAVHDASPPRDGAAADAAVPTTPAGAPPAARVKAFLRAILRFLRRRFVYLLPLAVLFGAVVLWQADPPFLRIFQLKVFDLYQQIRPRPYVPLPVKIIDMDEESLKRLGQWPWPRSRLAEMLARLFNAGAQVVAFDAVFAERDRTSPEQVLSIWLNQPELNVEDLPEEAKEFSNTILRNVPDHDEVFVDVIRQVGEISKRHGVVVGFTLTTEANDVVPKKKSGQAQGGDEPLQFLPAGFAGSAANLPEIEAAAKGVGSFNIVPDADSIVRRVPFVIRLGNVIYPSLAAEAIRVFQGANTYIIKASGANMEESFGVKTGLNHIKVGHVEVPVTHDGNMWVHYTDRVPERTIPAWKIFTEGFDPDSVAGHILYFGTSAAGLKDLRSTPLDSTAAGVEVHAQVTEQMLLGHYLSRPDWGDGAEVLLLILLSLVLIFLTPRFGAIAGAAIATGMLASAIFGSWYAYTDHLFLLDPLYPTITVLMVYLASTIVSYLDTETERRMVRGQFSQYLSPALVEQLAAEPDRLKLGGEMKEMTFLFCDVRGFTTISEQFKSDPQGLTRLINRFLTPMSETILARQGTIDKYMGDCIMAFWNAPFADPEHARHACESALAMKRALAALNERLMAEASAEGRQAKRLNVGMGINTGECVVGNMGSEQRFDYSVLGDAVNLAARLEGQSKTYCLDVIVGEDTERAAPDFALLELDLIAVKGRAAAARVYALLGDDEVKAAPEFQRLVAHQTAMLAAYRGQHWDEAAALLAELRAADERLDGYCDLFQERVDFYRESPPGEDWDGVFVATEK
ncbi:MAG: adenylate/guanylate cyclase domain-containing protein [Alphaproteobacteria bacterium]|nr:adenylate/guanylate cyclase domain-containing protein [Alphaproteobacteria bacterium]